MKPLSLYIHVPFCVKKCPYCDFLSAPAGEEAREAYLETLQQKIQQTGRILSGQGYQVTTVFFGGGTPTVLSGTQLAKLLTEIRASFCLDPGAEITAECNPKTADLAKLRQMHDAGFNRLSIGLQSAEDAELAVLGRIHSEADFEQTYAAARNAGFTNINVDLMSAIPGQTEDSLSRTLHRVLSLRPEHLSVYSLILEEGTPFYERYHTDPTVTDADRAAAMDALLHERLQEHGYMRYEISNYARPGFECRHNKCYWTGGEYLGIGPGAVSMMAGDCGLLSGSLPVRFMESGDTAGFVNRTVSYPLRPEDCAEYESLSKTDQMEEMLITGLRLCTGVARADFLSRFGVSLQEIYGPVIEKYKKLNLMAEQDDRVFCTEQGLEVSNVLLEDFLL